MTQELYQGDFHAWTLEQAALLKAGRLGEVDLEHLIEELESMGASERHQLRNRLKVLLAHLLKWPFQPDHQSRSWQATIKEQRLSLQDLLDENPSLRSTLDEQLHKAYRLAVQWAVRETNLDEAVFPENCPFKLTEILALDWLPQGESPRPKG